MAEAVSHLTDDQIEQLLSAAEHALAQSAPTKTALADTKQQALVAPIAQVPSVQQSGSGTTGQSKPVVKATEELSLRVPQLRTKEKKVCRLRAHFFLYHLLHDENLSQIQMTQRRAPVMGADPAHK